MVKKLSEQETFLKKEKHRRIYFFIIDKLCIIR